MNMNSDDYFTGGSATCVDSAPYRSSSITSASISLMFHDNINDAYDTHLHQKPISIKLLDTSVKLSNNNMKFSVPPVNKNSNMFVLKKNGKSSYSYSLQKTTTFMTENNNKGVASTSEKNKDNNVISKKTKKNIRVRFHVDSKDQVVTEVIPSPPIQRSRSRSSSFEQQEEMHLAMEEEKIDKLSTSLFRSSSSVDSTDSDNSTQEQKKAIQFWTRKEYRNKWNISKAAAMDFVYSNPELVDEFKKCQEKFNLLLDGDHHDYNFDNTSMSTHSILDHSLSLSRHASSSPSDYPDRNILTKWAESDGRGLELATLLVSHGISMKKIQQQYQHGLMIDEPHKMNDARRNVLYRNIMRLSVALAHEIALADARVAQEYYQQS